MKRIWTRGTAVIATCLLLVVSVALTACGTGAQGASKTSSSAGELVLPKYELPEDSFAVAMNEHRDYLVLVNEGHPYVFGDTYDELLQDDIIYVADCYGEPTPVEKAAYLAFTELQADLHAQGIEIALFSAYRTETDQQWVYDHYAGLEGWSETNRVVEPGFSEHHTGLMIEYVVWYNGGDEKADWEWYTVTAERAKDPYYAPIWKTLAKYGFILRYPEGVEKFTGMPYEPYELRFVGSSAIAKEITDAGESLETYLDLKEVDGAVGGASDTGASGASEVSSK